MFLCMMRSELLSKIIAAERLESPGQQIIISLPVELHCLENIFQPSQFIHKLEISTLSFSPEAIEIFLNFSHGANFKIPLNFKSILDLYILSKYLDSSILPELDIIAANYNIAIEKEQAGIDDFITRHLKQPVVSLNFPESLSDLPCFKVKQEFQ